MANCKFSEPGDLVYVAPSYANDRPWAYKWVGTTVLVLGLQQDDFSAFGPSFYYEVLVEGQIRLIGVDDVQLEPVNSSWLNDLQQA